MKKFEYFSRNNFTVSKRLKQNEHQVTLTIILVVNAVEEVKRVKFLDLLINEIIVLKNLRRCYTSR